MKQEGKKLAFILPSVIVTFVFYLFPLVYCLLYAFSGTSGHFTYAGKSNYLSLFQNETFQLALRNTYFLMLKPYKSRIGENFYSNKSRYKFMYLPSKLVHEWYMDGKKK